MKRYLDPKNDLVFKRVFGEHPHILRAMLNAILPLPPDKRIVSLEYLPAEQVPVIPAHKRTIVDVRCVDEKGRQFIVEMQMEWTTGFLQRVVFNACQAFVRQLLVGEDYNLLKPVIGLSLLNDVYDRTTDSFLHHYEIVKRVDTNSVIPGLEFVFVELPKFHSKASPQEREWWLRYFSEVSENNPAPEALRGKSPELDEALDLSEMAAYTPAQLLAYDKYWDAIRIERTLLIGKTEEGRAVGRAEGRAEGLAEGKAVGLAEGLEIAVQRLVQSGMSESDARKLLGI